MPRILFSFRRVCTLNNMKFLKLHYWPVFTFIWFTSTFVISYLVSVLGSKNVYFLWPMISDTGALPPESCIFGQMLNMAAIFMLITMYIRYRQIEIAIATEQIKLRKCWNTTSMVIGAMGCLGMSLVANFQETSIMIIHGLGAVLAFGIGSAYFIIEARISFAFKNPKSVGISKSVIVMRIILSALMLPLFFACFICVSYAGVRFKGRTIASDSIQWWTVKHERFKYRLGGAFIEWVMAITMMIFTVSFTNEFKSLEFKEVRFESKLDSPKP